MGASQWSEEERLGHWVGEVTRRWAAIGLSTRRRLDLFARLLARLAHARATAGTVTVVTSADPMTFADATAQEWSDGLQVRTSDR